MSSSFSLPKRLVSVPIFAIQLLLIHSVSSLNLTNDYLNHKCAVSEGNYKPGGKYEENLNFLTKSVSTYDLPDGFIRISRGDAPDSVTIILQCRGDSYESKCSSCFATALAGFRRKCHRHKGGIIWYDQCLLIISSINNENSRKIDYKNSFSMHNPKNVNEDPESFIKKTRDFLNELVLKAIKPDGVNLVYYASGEKSLGTKKLYAMVQCAQDTLQCRKCLEWNIMELPKCCNGKQGARFLSTSCNVRYELYPFLRTLKTV
ncbi:PREDICTED: putative cysteine-rich repeat secretory protein 37 [Camelina sativa]|uniref:Cysteine-rich repeat secretory protein 37 n=1 Tax=Camelina sativa TaxID=90675 RepID=A0ABM0W6Q2_CAMSA|nr:PREDICTED: putative cysteine-rich repeat secretory protein 37 [Camelina sativa]